MTTPYEIRRFEELLDAWIARDEPDSALRLAVLSWAFTRTEDPYQDAKREPGFANLWSISVPGTHRNGQVVLAAYWIIESEHAVRFDSIATLSWPA